MRKLFTVFAAVLVTASMFAQSPQGMSYQAVIRNGSGVLANAPIGMRISLLQGSASGTAVYVETQTPTSNANGLVSLEIGSGTVVTGTFASINWANGPYFIKTETDPAGGTNYTVTGTSQLLSVPYALHAQTAEAAEAATSMTQTERDALTATEGMIVYNLTTHKPNFYNGTLWLNSDGTAAQTLAIGMAYQGGIIAYILQPGDPGYDANVQHGIIAATSDQSTSMQWYNGAYTTTGATGTALGTGRTNTTIIIANQGAGSYAAQICAAYNGGGYNDWYLPSKDELNELYINKVAVGGFSPTYWSSTEYNNNNAWYQYFSSGNQYNTGKNFSFHVRAVRAF